MVLFVWVWTSPKIVDDRSIGVWWLLRWVVPASGGGRDSCSAVGGGVVVDTVSPLVRSRWRGSRTQCYTASPSPPRPLLLVVIVLSASVSTKDRTFCLWPTHPTYAGIWTWVESFSGLQEVVKDGVGRSGEAERVQYRKNDGRGVGRWVGINVLYS